MDWPAFLADHDIPYVTRGSGVRRDNIALQCPFCGDDDPSQHLSISLVKDAWGCWRNAQHCGRSPVRLVQALTGLSTAHARLVVRQFSSPDPEGLDEALAALQAAMADRPTPSHGTPRSSKPDPAVPHRTIFNDFCNIQRTGSTARFWGYLKRRGFDDVGDLVTRYHLRCATTDRWKDRVLIPFYQGGQLTGWTGRAIQPTIEAPRYLSSSDAVKRLVFNEDELKEGGKILYVVEGPFDALKLDYYGEPYQARATCIFGTSMTVEQVVTLRQLRRYFKQVVILLDRAAIEPAFDALDWLQGPNVTIGALPEGLKDPGAMSRDEVEVFIKGG